jgi:hypothetical protein
MSGGAVCFAVFSVFCQAISLYVHGSPSDDFPLISAMSKNFDMEKPVLSKMFDRHPALNT